MRLVIFAIFPPTIRQWSDRDYDDDSDMEFTHRRRPAYSSHRQHRSSTSYDRPPSSYDGSYDRPQYNRQWSNDELGSKIKKKVWDAANLPPLEKNFYVEHPSVAQKTEVISSDNFVQKQLFITLSFTAKMGTAQKKSERKWL